LTVDIAALARLERSEFNVEAQQEKFIAKQ